MMEKLTLLSFLNSTDNIGVEIESEVHKGKILDTKITLLKGGVLCWVSGEDREAFINDLNKLLDKYRI